MLKAKTNFLLIFLTVIILIAVISLAAACSPKLVDIDNDIEMRGDKLLKDNATLYDDATQWMKEEYAYNNRTITEDLEFLPEKVNVIASQEDFDNAFEDFPTEIDFDEQMLVLYFFAYDNLFAEGGKRWRYFELDNIVNEDDVITFECIYKKTYLYDPHKNDLVADSSIPTQNCLTILMPKVACTQLKFQINNKVYYQTWKKDLKSNATLYDAELDWFRDEYKEKNISKLAYPNTLTATIQTKEQYVSTFCKFYNDFDIEKDMLIVYCFTEENNGINDTYDYLITDIQYDKGFLDIEIDKRDVSTQSGATSTNTKILIIKLPQLPAYNVNITIN
ncbi:MAG: hypothetical protein ACI4MV_02145 [Christensenellales bacterium]